MKVPFRLSLAVQYASASALIPTRPQFRRWVQAALQRDAQIVLRITDEAEGRTLNKNFRGKDYATNVLAFPYGESDPLYGDIVVCAPVVETEAREQHKALPAHYAHLTVHAVLHLQGYDHDSAADAAAMESRETAILANLGYANPYQ
ncbi:MAG: rRNA maturation RNase YbeY [Pseudomonadota bacterium]